MTDADMVNDAKSIGQLVENVPCRLTKPTGNVRIAVLLVKTRANINSFHAHIAAKRADVAIIGLLKGTMMYRNTRKDPQPSITADSSISLGMDKMYDLIKNIVKER